ncbi:MAG: phosphoadenosine phosphosulfate reductase family protein [Treponema sp.]|nr:phosphoadenosine phosphosulfate reductase family protein [Treponema sp.]
MVVKREGSRTVLEAARKRILNAFSNGKKVYVSFSGGKDSLCLLDLTLSLAQEGKIDPKQMIVEFIDEEAIFDCIEDSVMRWRKKVLLMGAQFNWFCLEVRHFSCFNLLEQDENFICWDSTRKETWVRKPPPFAITKHPCMKDRTNTYQDFLMKHNSDGICITGVRMAESLQRSKYMAYSFSANTGLARGNMVWAIYDWKDTDVWRYLHEKQITIPDIYLFLYQSGSSLKNLRVSQFFSVDTAKSLVKMNEYYPALMDRIIKREPNAYLAALYWDSEMFRHSSKKRRELEDKKDYKAAVYKLLSDPIKNFQTKGGLTNAQRIIQMLIKYGPIIQERVYKTVYDCLVGGDPKQRTLRAIISTINMHYSQENNNTTRGKKHGK